MKKVLLVSATQKTEEEFWEDSPLGLSAKRHIECDNIDEVIECFYFFSDHSVYNDFNSNLNQEKERALHRM